MIHVIKKPKPRWSETETKALNPLFVYSNVSYLHRTEGLFSYLACFIPGRLQEQQSVR